MNDLYETDILEWSEHQAALLRRLAAGERVDDHVDWENVVEEIESVGNEVVHAVSSRLMQAMAHRLKAIGWPDARDVANWQADARRFAIDAADRFTHPCSGASMSPAFIAVRYELCRTTWTASRR